MKTYDWTVARLDCLPSTEIVVQVHWRCTATDGAYSASLAGAIAFAVPDEPETPYAELTQEQVIGWVKGQLGLERVDEIETDLASQVDALADPPVIAPSLPWQA